MDKLKAIANLRQNADFLGYEFLSWLFLSLCSENYEEKIGVILNDVIKNVSPTISLGSKVTTINLNNREQKNTVNSPILEECNEIFASIKNSHLIESMGVKISLDEQVIDATIHARDLGFSGVKIKADYENAGFDEQDTLSDEEQNREEIFLRNASMKDMETITNALIEHFFSIRLNPTRYKNELSAMREHVNSALNNLVEKNNTKTTHQDHPRYASLSHGV